MFSESFFTVHRTDGYAYLDEPPSGGDAPEGTLLFLHGMFGGLSNFDALISEMTGSPWRILVPRIPLYSMPRSELTIPDIADWVVRFLDVVTVERPVLLGNSMGGHVALELAHRHPGRIRRLVLTGSSGLLEKEFGTSFPKRNNREYIRKQASITFYDDLVDEKMIDEIQEVVVDTRKLVRLLSLARETREHCMEDALPEIYQPTLLIWGRQDRITPPEVGEMFLRLLPRADLQWIDRCGHAPMMERPREFTTLLNHFLNQETSTVKPLSNNEKDYTHI